jgi:hypothetical protein
MRLHDDSRAIMAQLPPCTVSHSASVKDIRHHWNSSGCAKILAEARLDEDDRLMVVQAWLKKAGLLDWLGGKLLLGFSRPLPVAPTEEQKNERRRKSLVRGLYKDEIPHARNLIQAWTERVEEVAEDTDESLAALDARQDREKESPGIMFAEFSKRIDDLMAIEYVPPKSGDDASAHVTAR